MWIAAVGCVFSYIQILVFLYFYPHTYIDTYAYTWIYDNITYIHLYIHAHNKGFAGVGHVCLHKYIDTHMCVPEHIHIHTLYMYTFTYMHAPGCVLAWDIYIHIHILTHIWGYKSICIYVRAFYAQTDVHVYTLASCTRIHTCIIRGLAAAWDMYILNT